MTQNNKERFKSFLEHFEELRSRLIKILICIAATSFLFFGFVDQVLLHIIKPLGKAVFTSPGEAFSVYMAVTFLGGVIISSPVVFYQIWQFISLGLTENERKHALIFIPLSVLFFLLGCSFAYFVLIPVLLKFFLSFSSYYLLPMIDIGRYISFVGNMVLVGGIVFQFPLVVAFLAKIGIATPAFLVEKRKQAIVAIFAASAVLTPSPDCISQIILAASLVVLYELSVIFAKYASRSSRHAGPTRQDRGPLEEAKTV